jgi:cytoskeletal protein CcmA (bactofilin family)
MAVSTIQSDLEINGNIQSQGDIEISGSIKGNVAANAVDVKDSGMIAGDITSEEVLTEGKIKGKIKATSVNLRLTSSTDTNMVSNTLVVETGATIFGKFKIGQ